MGSDLPDPAGALGDFLGVRVDVGGVRFLPDDMAQLVSVVAERGGGELVDQLGRSTLGVVDDHEGHVFVVPVTAEDFRKLYLEVL